MLRWLGCLTLDLLELIRFRRNNFVLLVILLVFYFPMTTEAIESLSHLIFQSNSFCICFLFTLNAFYMNWRMLRWLGCLPLDLLELIEFRQNNVVLLIFYFPMTTAAIELFSHSIFESNFFLFVLFLPWTLFIWTNLRLVLLLLLTLSSNFLFTLPCAIANHLHTCPCLPNFINHTNSNNLIGLTNSRHTNSSKITHGLVLLNLNNRKSISTFNLILMSLILICTNLYNL